MVRNRTERKKSEASPWTNPLAAARKLQWAVVRTMPLYAHISLDSAYTEQLVSSINGRRSDVTMELVKKVLPFVSVSVGAGFGTMFKMGDTYLEVGTYRPGKKLNARDLQHVARMVYPLLQTIAMSPDFTIALLQQYGNKNKQELLRLITTVIPADQIKEAGTDHYGFYFVITSPSGACYNVTLYLYE